MKSLIQSYGDIDSVLAEAKRQLALAEKKADVCRNFVKEVEAHIELEKAINDLELAEARTQGSYRNWELAETEIERVQWLRQFTRFQKEENQLQEIVNNLKKKTGEIN